MGINIISSAGQNRQKWTELIRTSSNASVYDYPWYLDGLCEWELLSKTDFSGGMVLPYKRQWGFKRYYQPALIQQCRWIGQQPTTEELIEIDKLLRQSSSDFHLNTNLSLTHFRETKRTNLVLPLAENADTLFQNFGKDLRKNIRKSQNKVSVVSVDNAAVAIQLYQQAYGSLNPQLKTEDYNRIASIINKAVEAEHAEILLALDTEDKNIVLASAVFLKGHERLHYILGAPSASGRKINALSVLLWQLIQDYSSTPYTLDFEGSSIPAVAAYYKRFGAKEEFFKELQNTSSPLFKLLRSLKQGR